MAEKVIPEIRIYKTFMAAYLEHVGIAAHADLPWEQLDNCNILVTGATGLIGSCLVEVLLSHKDANYQVYASGRNECLFGRAELLHEQKLSMLPELAHRS